MTRFIVDEYGINVELTTPEDMQRAFEAIVTGARVQNLIYGRMIATIGPVIALNPPPPAPPSLNDLVWEIPRLDAVSRNRHERRSRRHKP